MRIIYLGTGSAIGADDTGASLLINENILIDAPGGIAHTLFKFGGDIGKLNSVILTHLHGDHVLGLPMLLLEYLIKPRETPLNIVAPAGTRELLSKLVKLTFPEKDEGELLAPSKPLFNIITDGSKIPVGDIIAGFHKVPHGDIETYGIEFPIHGKKKIFYAPDTSYSDELVKIIASVDVAVLDATTPDAPIDGHMSMKQINDLAKEFPDKTFMLTHRSRYNTTPESYTLPANVRAPSAGEEFLF